MDTFERARRLLRPLVFAWLRPRLEGLRRIPESGAALLAGAHPSVLDGLVLGLASPRPVRFLVAGELFRHPLIGAVLRWAGCIPVDRSGGRNGDALAAARQALRQGEVVGIFPEGRTNAGGPLLDLRPGVALLALGTGAPVVPFGMAGTERSLPPGGRLHPGPVALCFGRPLDLGREPRDPIPAPRLEEALQRLALHLRRGRERAERLLEGAATPHGPSRWLAGMVLVPLARLLAAPREGPDRRSRRAA